MRWVGVKIAEKAENGRGFQRAAQWYEPLVRGQQGTHSSKDAKGCSGVRGGCLVRLQRITVGDPELEAVGG